MTYKIHELAYEGVEALWAAYKEQAPEYIDPAKEVLNHVVNWRGLVQSDPGTYFLARAALDTGPIFCAWANNQTPSADDLRTSVCNTAATLSVFGALPDKGRSVFGPMMQAAYRGVINRDPSGAGAAVAVPGPSSMLARYHGAAGAYETTVSVQGLLVPVRVRDVARGPAKRNGAFYYAFLPGELQTLLHKMRPDILEQYRDRGKVDRLFGCLSYGAGLLIQESARTIDDDGTRFLNVATQRMVSRVVRAAGFHQRNGGEAQAQ